MKVQTNPLAGAQRILGLLALPAMVITLYMAFIWAPEERTLGEVQRIFYFHVGSAWNAYLAFLVVFIASVMFLMRRKPGADAVAVSAAEIGVLFTTLTLVTGSFWARASWNVWWTWDPRLTTTLIMWFMYIAYLLIRAATDGEERRGRLAAVFGIISFANVPLVHYSAKWWRGMHPTVVDLHVPRPQIEMEPSMMVTMFVALAALSLLSGYLFTQRFGLEHLRRRVDRLKERVRLEVDN